jgi:transcriptional regulator with XRE-family HTH domain
MSLEAGRSLRRVREQLKLRYRDVEESSQLIAKRHANSEFTIGLSRLADIENRGTVPSIYRLYSLSAIYGLDFQEVMRWYGVNFDLFPQDLAALNIPSSRPLNHQPAAGAYVQLPSTSDGMIDIKKTSFLSRHLKSWGKFPLSLVKALNPECQRYALIGLEDWSMYPMIAPGSFVQIDETKRRVSNSGWPDDHSRPIYFIEHRNGFRCGWCSERRGLLIVQGPSSCQVPAEVFQFPGEVEIIGQVVAVAMRLDRERPHRKRSSAALK